MRWLALLCLASCGSKAVPDSFIFGAAMAGFQVEPGCPTLPAAECEDRNSDWYQWVNSPDELSDLKGTVTFEPISRGPGQWELYETDFDLAQRDLGLGSIRMSLEWSRIFPTATDGVDDPVALRAMANSAALARYHQIFAALKARGLKPLVTLHHYTLPLWLHDGVACHKDLEHCAKRGWLNHDRAVAEIARYAAFCAREFGSEVDWWATQNEPFAVVLPGYLFPSYERANPPGVTLKIAEAKAAMVAMIDAHARMYDAVKANDTFDADGDGINSWVGLVYATVPTAGRDPGNRVDARAAANVFYLYNTAFLDGVIKGLVDADLSGAPDSAAPRIDLAGRMDWLGINYYTRVTLEGTGAPIFPTLSPLSTFDPTTLVQAKGDTKGLYDIVQAMQARYHLPMIITETGRDASPDPADASRWLIGAMTWAKRAIRDGADLRGFYVWSLIDNYEWNQGMNAKLGLYAVDLDEVSRPRRAREAATAYRDVVKARDVPGKWLEKYPAPE